MGGYGSGTWHRWGSKTTTDAFQNKFDLRSMKKQGYLRPGFVGPLPWATHILFRVEKDRMIIAKLGGMDAQTIKIERTPCRYGGFRLWFLCPKCGARRLVLYNPSSWGCKSLSCRECLDLTYASQQETKEFRINRKLGKIYPRIGFVNFFTDHDHPYPQIIFCKPKHMHWKTYMRLKKEAITAEGQWLTHAEARVIKIKESLARLALAAGIACRSEEKPTKSI